MFLCKDSKKITLQIKKIEKVADNSKLLCIFAVGLRIQNPTAFVVE